MSGGYYDHLCHKDVEELLEMEEQLERMAERLGGLGAVDAQEATRYIVERLQLLKADIDQQRVRLHLVWKAVEWLDSGDWGPGQLQEALERYRAGE